MGEGESAYAYKGLPCKDGYIRGGDDVEKKVLEKKYKKFSLSVLKRFTNQIVFDIMSMMVEGSQPIRKEIRQ